MHQLAATRPARQAVSRLFSLRDLGYRYPDGTPALAGIDLDIFAGDRLALVGQNGAGKTTLAKHLNGLLKPDQGEITYRGQPLAGAHLTQARLEIGLLFQDADDQLFCNSIREDVLFGPRNQGLDPAEAEAAAEAALADVDLLGDAERPPHTLSYGQRKRAALATLLAMQPEVLILDEPTANLDPRQEQLLLDLLLNYPGTLICITHNLLFAYELCQRAVVLAQGRVHHDDSLRELVAHQPSQREHGLDFSFRFAGDPPQPGQGRPAGSPANRQPPLLAMTGYSYRYPDGRQALRDLTFAIRRGDRLALVGENGAGKSTLAGCLAGLRLGLGNLTLDGRTITSRTRRELTRQAGLVFQDCADQLFCPSCFEEVAFGPRQLGWPSAAINAAVTDALQRVRLENFAERVPLHLSGGERKRLALAAVLALRPQILILDEPTAGLDPQGEELLLDILSKFAVTLLLISHDLHFIRRLTERTLVLHEGRLVQDYATDDFFADADLNSLNQLDYSYRSASELRLRELRRKAAEG
ncbi:MAG TPA: energy-coupling factor transporter ATPase [Desulfuromonadales bacterium]|nr:energy-coupling factor transporter ATPase [Desulfuromonadales bacterium]